MAITLNQIAEICGVSRGTVDRALHNKGNVRPAVAERIKAVANEYGYIPNRPAVALARSGRTGLDDRESGRAASYQCAGDHAA